MKRPRWTGISRKALGSHTLYMRAYRAKVKAKKEEVIQRLRHVNKTTRNNPQVSLR